MQNTLIDDLIRTTRKREPRRLGRSRCADIRCHPQSAFGLLRRRPRVSVSRRSATFTTRCTRAPALTLEHDKAEEVVTHLFDFWMENMDELPQGYIDEAETEGHARVVADYIAGMTDSFILQQYVRDQAHGEAGNAPLEALRGQVDGLSAEGVR